MKLLAHDHEALKSRPRPSPADSVGRWHHGAEVVLDLSRLLSRALHPAPTGVDRVEMAYARTLLRLIPHRLRFGAVHPSGIYGRLPLSAVERFLDATEARWEVDGAHETRALSRRIGLAHCWALRPRPVPPALAPRVVLQASPHHLDRPTTLAAKLVCERARFVCLLHDLIPISHPEYARADGRDRHLRRLRTIEAYAAGVLVNSRATFDALIDQAGGNIAGRPIRVAHLGIEHRPESATPPGLADRTYFVCIATIEPRKNHLLLLNVWRSIVEKLGPDRTPNLLLIGRRGWENENVIDMLERCPSLAGIVRELADLPDSDLRPLLNGARAVLMPSFVEGFGLPIAEALAKGVPVLASDIPAHREAGGTAPEYFDPIDGTAWRSAILDYAAPSSVRRRAQLERLAGWQPIYWDQHMDIALSLIEEVMVC